MNENLNKSSLFCVIFLSLAICGLICFDTLKNKNMQQPVNIKNEAEYKESNMVVFNPNSLKYHKKDCEWALKCKRCIKVSEEYAIEQGGVPCKVCKD